MSAVERIASVHEKVALAAMDCAADELRDSLNDADQCGAWDVPAHRRDAEQDEAVIRVQEARRLWRSSWRCSWATGTASTLVSHWRCCDE